MPKQLFSTERLDVREIDMGDVKDIFEVYSDEEAMTWVGDGSPIKYTDCIKWVDITLENYKQRGYGLSAIYEKTTSKHIGFCGIVHPGGQPEPELKYALRKEYWGHGYGTEVAKGMTSYGQKELQLPRIISTVAEEHSASQKVLQKAGYSYQSSITEDDNSRTLTFAIG
ncbi:GNAT family N-acetyltransferase [Pelagicoccus albus]|uniref:GNAT family N-acetyltransferase n=1 Tax=Pelagicoccus albus TaxID=415222 RepID=A0A7X1B5A9_9BACT|nr:GNAT family N-acetyltransferase [Pelagicoccus albus]MBC2605924.1 GNAT family N-acetyltransferase [Pelagicoccus albus]